MITVRRKLTFDRRSDRTCRIRVVDPAQTIAPPPSGCVPRVSRLMALAIEFERILRDGEVADQSELARLVHVSQPRLTQIMNMNHLAPDIQEALLHLPLSGSGRHPICERRLRSIAALTCWRQQRTEWRRIIRNPEASPNSH